MSKKRNSKFGSNSITATDVIIVTAILIAILFLVFKSL